MYLLGKRTDKLDAGDIERLVNNKVQENRSLDYKRELKLSQDKERKEFLFDITSMSNTEGGCFIFGIEESKDEKGQNTGTPESITGITIENYDKLSQQIEDIVNGNTEPSISYIALNHLIVGEKNVLVIGVSKSLGLPVMVTFNDTNKFYKRRNSGKYSVDVYELNQMFMENQVLKESAEKFRYQRIEKVRALKVFPNLDISTSFFIHIIPYSFQNEQMLDLTKAYNSGITTIMTPLNLRGWDKMYNVDGFSTFGRNDGSQIISYDQLFRNRIYEVYSSSIFEKRNFSNGREMLYMDGGSFIHSVIEKYKQAISVLKIFQIEPPFIISITLIGMKDGVIYSGARWSQPFLINEIYLPPVIIQTFESDIYELLKPIFDIIWQSVSENQSPTYNPS